MDHKGVLGFSENTEKMVVSSHCHFFIAIRSINRFYARFCSCPFYLCSVLNRENKTPFIVELSRGTQGGNKAPVPFLDAQFCSNVHLFHKNIDPLLKLRLIPEKGYGVACLSALCF
jgi:hypothetical protein